MTTTETPLEPIKLLMVENEKSLLQKMMDLLQKTSPSLYNIVEAWDLKQAMERLSHETFDVVLFNLALPDSGGLFTIEKLRPFFYSTPFIVTNGPDDETLAFKALNEGVSDYVAKDEVGTGSFFRAIRFAHERAKGLKTLGARMGDPKALKLQSLGRITGNVVDEFHPSIEDIHHRISELKKELIEQNVLSDSAKRHLTSAEDSAKNLKEVVADLIEFSKEISQHLTDSSEKLPSHYRILVVDDEPMVSDVIVKRLQRLGYKNIDTAGNGVEALNKCIAPLRDGLPSYDLIISDWKMPKMTGLEFLSKIRSHHILKNIPFMMVSAVDDRAEIQEAAKLKLSQYLLKPFTKEEFDKRFKRLLYQVH